MDSGAANAVIGDITDAMDIPVTQIKEEDLVTEKNMAKFSKSKEYQKLKEHVEGRIEFFQTYLPDGRAVAAEGVKLEALNNWVVANIVISEFRAILSAYDNANEVVEKYVAGRA